MITHFDKTESHPVAVQSKPIGYITGEVVGNTGNSLKSLILCIASMYDVPYFLLKETEDDKEYIVETGNFTQNGKDFNARCRINDKEYRLVIPGNVMKMIEPKPVKVFPEDILIK